MSEKEECKTFIERRPDQKEGSMLHVILYKKLKEVKKWQERF